MSLNAEINRAQNAESVLNLAVVSEQQRASGVEAGLGSSISLNYNLIANVQNSAISSALIATQGILASQASILSENTMAIAALQTGGSTQSSSSSSCMTQIAALQTQQNQLNTGLNNEVVRALNAESALTQSIANAPSSSSTALSQLINNEIVRATAAEANVWNYANALSGQVATNMTSTTASVSTEALRAWNAETSLAQNLGSQNLRISTNDARAISVEQTMANQIAALTAAYNLTGSNGITATGVAASIAVETTRAMAAESALGVLISGSTSTSSTDVIQAAGQGGALSIGTAASTGDITLGNYSHTVNVHGNMTSSSVISDANDHDYTTINGLWLGAFPAIGSPNTATGNIRAYRKGSAVTLTIYPFQANVATANTVATFDYFLPGWACPSNATSATIPIYNNSLMSIGFVMIGTNGSVTLCPYNGYWALSTHSGVTTQACISYSI